MNPYKKFAKDVGLMGITHAILGLQAFLLLPILTKFLGATDFGIWSQIKITVSLLGGFAMLGLGTAVIRFMSGQEDKRKVSKEFISILFITVGGALIFGLIIFIFSDKIGLLLTHITYSGFFFKFVILLLLLGVIHGVFTTFFRAKENVKLYSTIEIARAVLEIALIYIFLSKEFGLFGVIGAFILTKIVIIFFCLANIKKYIKFVKPSFRAIKPHLSFSLPLTIAPLLFWILQVGDQYIIGYFIGAKAVGIYALAYSLGRVIRIIADPILFILHPSLSKAWNQGRKDELRIYFGYAYKYIFMIIIPAIFGLSLLAEPILRIISTEEFVEGKILIPIIGAGVGIYLLFSLAVLLLQLTKETKKITKILIVLSVLNISLNIVLVPLLGIVGAAIATLITFLVAGIYSLGIIKKMRLELMPFFMIKCLFCSIIMGGFIVFIRNIYFENMVLKLAIIVLFSILIYFILLYLVKGIKKPEIMFFVKLVKSNKEAKNINNCPQKNTFGNMEINKKSTGGALFTFKRKFYHVIKSLLWYAKNPKFYGEFFCLFFLEVRRLLNPFNSSKKQRILSKKWCAEKAIDTQTALIKITGKVPSQTFNEKFRERVDISKKIGENCPAHMGGPGNLGLLYYLSEYLQAIKVIETGIAYGWSSLAILLSLKNREGSLLISTDKPYPGRNNEKYVGCVVPSELRTNWRIIKSADRKAIPEAIIVAGKIDMCHYDSDKSYEGRSLTYPLLWKALRPGGIFISDDIGDNLAFRDFCKKIGKEPMIVDLYERYVGILLKN